MISNAYIYTYTYIYIYIYICICTYIYIYISPQLVHAHVYATMQQLLCHGSYCERILSLAWTSYRLSFPPALLPLCHAGHPPASPLPVRSRNLSKSTPAHDAVAAVVLHKHHPIICVGAGLIQWWLKNQVTRERMKPDSLIITGWGLHQHRWSDDAYHCHQMVAVMAYCYSMETLSTTVWFSRLLNSPKLGVRDLATYGAE